MYQFATVVVEDYLNNGSIIVPIKAERGKNEKRKL